MFLRSIASVAVALLIATSTPATTAPLDLVGEPPAYYTTSFEAADGKEVVVRTKINDNDLADSIARHRLRVQQAWKRAHR